MLFLLKIYTRIFIKKNVAELVFFIYFFRSFFVCFKNNNKKCCFLLYRCCRKLIHDYMEWVHFSTSNTNIFTLLLLFCLCWEIYVADIVQIIFPPVHKILWVSTCKKKKKREIQRREKKLLNFKKEKLNAQSWLYGLYNWPSV